MEEELFEKEAMEQFLKGKSPASIFVATWSDLRLMAL